MSRRLMAVPLAVALFAAGMAAATTPEQDLFRAFQYLDQHRYAQARDLAQAYLRTQGPRFSAAFIVATAECMLHPHLASNAAAFRQLRVDYVVGSEKMNIINSWIRQCASPPPPPQPQEAGVSASGLSSLPSLRAAEPGANEPPPTHPRPTPPAPIAAVIAHPVVAARVTPASDICIQGYVWREAFAGDHVCVTPLTRAQAAEDNRLAASRRDPSGAYGPNTCIQGFVWRAARDGDAVCVTPDRRTQATVDNREAAARRLH
ncbi:hypothetical protein [Sphingomonas sp. MMS24-J13]|uniref:hypothetical protein n=1 Tax=Sphingomonas sp. MMS24-J13 TaxID=3238686 RepID=UPI003850FF9B